MDISSLVLMCKAESISLCVPRASAPVKGGHQPMCAQGRNLYT